jgi:predicted DNA-binding protein
MPLSLRISPEKEKMIQQASEKAGKSKTAFIIEAIDEKHWFNQRQRTVDPRNGWLPLSR